MGNIGRPSTGCGLCRKRRVKCDEGRPGCGNCARLKKPCPGYREPGYGLIRPTVFISNTSPRSQKRSTPEFADIVDPQPSFTPPSSKGHHFAETCHARDSSPDLEHPSPSKSLCFDVPERAVWYSLAQLDNTSRVLYGNNAFDFLPGIISKSGHDSYLYAAMRAVGAANLANRSPTVDMQSVVDYEYARAVSGVTAALADPVQCLKDETLVAVWLLAMRELLAGISGTRCSSSQQTHIDGTLMLLRLRGEDQFSTPEGRHLFHLLLSSMHWRPLFAGEEPSQEYLLLESQIPKAAPTVVPMASIRLRQYFHGVSKLRARVKNFLLVRSSPSIDKIHTVNSYLKAASRLEDKMRGWCDVPSWLPKKTPFESSPTHPHKSPWSSGTLFRRYTFECWAGFFHWNRYFAAKICLHAAILDALASLSEDRAGDEVEASTLRKLTSSHTAALHETIGDLLGTVAYAFGDLDGDGRPSAIPTAVVSDGRVREPRGINVPATLQVQPPLSYLITLRYLAPGQREAMYLALRRVRAEFSVL